MALTLDSYYDPLVEFQELAVGVDGRRTWKVTGPDLNGHYGGLNGVGGLEATIQENSGTVTPVLNDYFGNVLATISGSTANWNSVRVGGYGPVLGYQAATLTASTPLAETLLWRSRRMDPGGYYNLGARYYDPLAGRFLSPDPLGHAGSMDLYSFCSGDPLNRFDPTGRFGKWVAAIGEGVTAFLGDQAQQFETSCYNAFDALMNPIVSTLVGPAAAQTYFPGGYEAGSSYLAFMNQSSATQLGYNCADAVKVGLQVGLIAATLGVAELAPVLEGAEVLEDANAMRMGGTMALVDTEEAGVVTSEGMADSFQYAQLKDYYSAQEASSAPAVISSTTTPTTTTASSGQTLIYDVNLDKIAEMQSQTAQIQNVLDPYAQGHRTTAVLDTSGEWGCAIRSCVDCHSPSLQVFRDEPYVSRLMESPSLEAWLSSWLNGQNLWNMKGS
jgi:RHS repeat-associated protein